MTPPKELPAGANSSSYDRCRGLGLRSENSSSEDECDFEGLTGSIGERAEDGWVRKGVSQVSGSEAKPIT